MGDLPGHCCPACGKFYRTSEDHPQHVVDQESNGCGCEYSFASPDDSTWHMDRSDCRYPGLKANYDLAIQERQKAFDEIEALKAERDKLEKKVDALARELVLANFDYNTRKIQEEIDRTIIDLRNYPMSKVIPIKLRWLCWCLTALNEKEKPK